MRGCGSAVELEPVIGGFGRRVAAVRSRAFNTYWSANCPSGETRRRFSAARTIEKNDLRAVLPSVNLRVGRARRVIVRVPYRSIRPGRRCVTSISRIADHVAELVPTNRLRRKPAPHLTLQDAAARERQEIATRQTPNKWRRPFGDSRPSAREMGPGFRARFADASAINDLRRDRFRDHGVATMGGRRCRPIRLPRRSCGPCPVIGTGHIRELAAHARRPDTMGLIADPHSCLVAVVRAADAWQLTFPRVTFLSRGVPCRADTAPRFATSSWQRRRIGGRALRAVGHIVRLFVYGRRSGR